MKYSTLTDEQLAQRYSQGESAALTELVKRWRGKAIGYCQWRMNVQDIEIAKDLVQDSFIKTFKALKKGLYNEKSGKFSTWFFVILRNTVIDFLRNPKNRKLVRLDIPLIGYEDMERTIPSEIDDPEEILIEFEEHLKYDWNKLLDKLPDKARLMIVLRYFQRLTYEEIANFMSVPLGTVKATLCRAIELLGQALENEKVESEIK